MRHDIKTLLGTKDYSVEKKLERKGSVLRFLRTKSGRYVLKESASNVSEEVAEQRKVRKKIEHVPYVTAPKVVASDEQAILYEYKQGVVLEKFCVQNVGMFKNNQKSIRWHIDNVAKALAKIHVPSQKSIDKKTLSYFSKSHKQIILKEEVVELHGDVNTENILCSEKQTVFLDPSGKKVCGSRYFDVACFTHHLCFKTPFKYLSLSAFIHRKKYESYFLKRYCEYSGESINRLVYEVYRCYHLRSMARLAKKNAKNKAFIQSAKLRIVHVIALLALRRREKRVERMLHDKESK